MLNFNENDKNSQILAKHYSEKIGDKFVISFMSSLTEINSNNDAILVTTVFWKMVDLSSEDIESNVSVSGIEDLEFWMHKLFNKVLGYMTKNGYKEQWIITTKEIKFK